MIRKRKLLNAVPLTQDPLWYKDAVIYELHVRAFADSNGDGIGDFRGLVRKLDYLQDLGVTALWLLPFYPSPLRDDGYDISDYTNINPIYGSLGDFKLFLRAAHRRGLRVITELVINHTSDRHPWFQRARKSAPGTSERNFYVWSDTPEKYRDARIIFKDFEPSNWSWDAVAGAYYWHRFFGHQPDLNFENPEVHEAILEILDFWLEMGIDGLRLDAVPYLYEREGTSSENLPETHEFLKSLRGHIEKRFDCRMLLAEANQWPEDAVAYFGGGDECHMAFHFPVMPRLFMAIRMEDRFPVIDILRQTPSIPESCQWALFLRNHDELTLEMVTDEDRDYMYRMYAQDPQARVNLGIRRRLAPLLENHRAKIELMNGLLFSLPGTPVIYYGDEIGMGDNIYLGDRNGVRTPMQWSPERNAGFSGANPQRLFLPVIIDPEYHFESVNVEAQQNNAHSFLWWMKRLLALRKRYQAFGRGSLEFLSPKNHKVLAFVRSYHDERILVVANLSRFAQCVELEMPSFAGMIPVELFGRTAFPAIGQSPYMVTLGPYAFYWFSVEPRRAEIVPARPGADRLPVIETVRTWDTVFLANARAYLEDLLPDYLRACHWFHGKHRQIEAAMLLETIAIPFGDDGAEIALVQVEFSEGEAETYVLPLAFATGNLRTEIESQLPEAIVARLRVQDPARDDASSVEGILFDPTGEKSFSSALIEAIRRGRRFKRAGGEIVGITFPSLRRVAARTEALPPASLLKSEPSNSVMLYGDRFVLKLIRRVEEGLHPEVEVQRFLTERTSFSHIPHLAGAFEYRRSWGKSLTLAILNRFEPNEGDAWRFTLDALGSFLQRVLTGGRAQQDLLQIIGRRRDALENEPPAGVRELIGPFLETARLLGRRIAEFHCALASDDADPGFAPEPFTPVDQRSLYQSVRTKSFRALDQLGKRLSELPEAAQKGAERALQQESVLQERLRRLLERRVIAMKIRCHGSINLSQLLYTGKDFVIVDFEGEVKRTFSERRRKRLPVEDLAGLVRSFHYAAALSLSREDIRAADVPTLDPWVRFWRIWVSATFLKAYLEVTESKNFLPRSRDEFLILMETFLLERLMTEIVHQIDHRPDRVAIPVQGVLQILAEAM